MQLAPSMNTLFVTGILLLVAFYLVVTHFADVRRLDIYRKLSLLSILVVAIGVHGLLHLGMETVYGFNPYAWF